MTQSTEDAATRERTVAGKMVVRDVRVRKMTYRIFLLVLIDQPHTWYTYVLVARKSCHSWDGFSFSTVCSYWLYRVPKDPLQDQNSITNWTSTMRYTKRTGQSVMISNLPIIPANLHLLADAATDITSKREAASKRKSKPRLLWRHLTSGAMLEILKQYGAEPYLKRSNLSNVTRESSLRRVFRRSFPNFFTLFEFRNRHWEPIRPELFAGRGN
jgi:hypothetical protein